jgi:hypothetical protein
MLLSAIRRCDEWHLDLEKTSRWITWVATQLAHIQAKSEIYVPFVDVTGERNRARQIACGVSDRRAAAPAGSLV